MSRRMIATRMPEKAKILDKSWAPDSLLSMVAKKPVMTMVTTALAMFTTGRYSTPYRFRKAVSA